MTFKIGIFEKEWSEEKINHIEELIRNINSTSYLLGVFLVFLICLSNSMANGNTFPEYYLSKVFRYLLHINIEHFSSCKFIFICYEGNICCLAQAWIFIISSSNSVLNYQSETWTEEFLTNEYPNSWLYNGNLSFSWALSP